ncbi:MAG: hypothetical protein ACKVSF_14575 [Alphaproteobacteria bacterium]
MRHLASFVAIATLFAVAPAAADVTTVSPREVKAFQLPSIVARTPQAPECPPSLCSSAYRQGTPAPTLGQPYRPPLATNTSQAVQGQAIGGIPRASGTSSAPAMQAPAGWTYVATPPACAGSTCVSQPSQLLLKDNPRTVATTPSVAGSSAASAPASVARAPSSVASAPSAAAVSGTTQSGTASTAPAAPAEAQKAATAAPAENQSATATTTAASSSGGSDPYADKKKAEDEAARRALRELEERMRHEGAKRIREEAAARARGKLGYADVETVERADGVVVASTPPPSAQTIQNLAAVVRAQGAATDGAKKSDGCDFEGLCGKAAEKAAKEAQDALNKARDEARRIAREQADKAKKELKEQKEKLKQAERERRKSATRELEDQQREKAERLSKEAKDLEKRGKAMADKQKALEDDERRLRREEGEIRKNDPNCRSAACQSKQSERAANSKATTDLARESGKFQSESARFQGQIQEFNRSQDKLEKMKDAGEGMTRDDHRAHLAEKRSAQAGKEVGEIETRIQDLKARQLEVREKGGSGSREDKALQKEIEAGGKVLDKAKAFAQDTQKDVVKAKAAALGLKSEYEAYERGRNALEAGQAAKDASGRLTNIEVEEARLRKAGASAQALDDIKKLKDQALKDVNEAKKDADKALSALGKTDGKPRDVVKDINKFVENFSTAQAIDQMSASQLRDQITIHDAAEKRIDQALAGVGGKIPPAAGPVYDAINGLQKDKAGLEKKLTDMDKSLADAFKRGAVPASTGAAFAEARKEVLAELDAVNGKIGTYGALGAADAVTADVLEINKSLARLTAGLPLDKAGNVDKDALAKQVIVAGQAQMEIARANGELAGIEAKRAAGGKLSTEEEGKAAKLRSQVQDLTKQLKGLGIDAKFDGDKSTVTADTLAGAVTWNAAREAVTEMVSSINETKKKVASLRNEPAPRDAMTEPPRAAPSPARTQAAADAAGAPPGANAASRSQERNAPVPPVKTVEPTDPPGPSPGGDLNAAGGRIAKAAAVLGGAVTAGAGAVMGAKVGAAIGTADTSDAETRERAPQPVKEVKPERPPEPAPNPSGTGQQIASLPPATAEDLSKLRGDAEAARKQAQELERAAQQAEREAKRATDEAERARREADEKKRAAAQQSATAERQAAGYGQLAANSDADAKKYEDQAKALRDKAEEMRKSAERYDRAAALAKDKGLADAARQAATNAREDAAKEERRAADQQKIADDWKASGGRHRDSAQGLKGGPEKLKAEAARADAEAERKAAEAARLQAEAERKTALAAGANLEIERKRADLQKVQAENLQNLLRNPPSTTFWSSLKGDERSRWLRDNVPDWDNLTTASKLNVLRALDASESRTQAIAAGQAFDAFVKDKNLTEKSIEARAGRIDSLRKQLEAKKNEWFISESDTRTMKSLEGQIRRETASLSNELRQLSELRDDVVEKSRRAQRDYFQVDEEARNREALRRIDQLAATKGELRVVEEAVRVREDGFAQRVADIQTRREAAQRAGDAAGVARHDTALRHLEAARAEWKQHDTARLRGLEGAVNEQREKVRREALDVGLYAITDPVQLDRMADARLLQSGVPAARLNGEAAIARDSVGAVSLEDEKKGFWRGAVETYDLSKTSVAVAVGGAYGTVKGAVKGLAGLVKTFIWEPIDSVGEDVEIAMEIVTGARTNVFGTDNQDFVMGVVNDPSKTAKAIFLGLGKEVFDFGQNVKKAGTAVAERDAAAAFDASKGVGEFVGEYLLDPSLAVGAAGKLARVAGKAASVAVDAARVATAAGKVGEVARVADTAVAAAGKLDTAVGAAGRLETAAARGSAAERAAAQMPTAAVPGTSTTMVRLPPAEAAGLKSPKAPLGEVKTAGVDSTPSKVPLPSGNVPPARPPRLPDPLAPSGVGKPGGPPPELFTPTGAQPRAPPSAAGAVDRGAPTVIDTSATASNVPGKGPVVPAAPARAAGAVDRGAPTVIDTSATASKLPGKEAALPPVSPANPLAAGAPDGLAGAGANAGKPRLADTSAPTRGNTGGPGGPRAPPPAAGGAGPAPMPDAVSVKIGADDALILRRHGDGAELHLPKSSYAGEGSFSNAYRAPKDPSVVLKLTQPGDSAAALDDLGRAAVQSVGDPRVIQTPAVIKRYDIVDSVVVPSRRNGIGDKNFAGGTLSVVEAAPPAFKDAPASVTLADGTTYRVKADGGAMTPGQRVAYDKGIRALNEKGYAWLDNKHDNYTFRRSGPPGADEWSLVVVDPGGIIPLKGASLAERGAHARALQQAVDSPVPDVRRIYGNQFGPAYHKGYLADKFDGAVDWARVESVTGKKFDTLGGGETSIPYNPRNAIDHPEISALASAGTKAEIEATRKATLANLPPPELLGSASGFSASASKSSASAGGGVPPPSPPSAPRAPPPGP